MVYLKKRKTSGYRASSIQNGIVKRMPSTRTVGQIMDDRGRMHPFTEVAPVAVGDGVNFKINPDGHAFDLRKTS